MLYAASYSNFALFNAQNADLYYTFKRNIVGGPSIIFNRYDEKDKTTIKNQEGNFCKSIVGYDCNGLYSYAIKQPMPTGLFVRRLEENQFKPETSEKYIDSYVWMDYLMKTNKIKIMDKLNNNREVRIGSYLVDGYCVETKTVYEFNGCYFHHCKYNCDIIKQIKTQSWIQKIKKVSERDEKKKQFLVSRGYKYISTKIYEKYLPSYYRSHKGHLFSNGI